jgi:curved DNA-binding protein CbpA
VVISASYRALAKLAHPDAGGDAEQMRALNEAYERLTQRTRSQGAA